MFDPDEEELENGAEEAQNFAEWMELENNLSNSSHSSGNGY